MMKIRNFPYLEKDQANLDALAKHQVATLKEFETKADSDWEDHVRRVNRLTHDFYNNANALKEALMGRGASQEDVHLLLYSRGSYLGMRKVPVTEVRVKISNGIKFTFAKEPGFMNLDQTIEEMKIANARRKALFSLLASRPGVMPHVPGIFSQGVGNITHAVLEADVDPHKQAGTFAIVGFRMFSESYQGAEGSQKTPEYFVRTVPDFENMADGLWKHEMNRHKETTTDFYPITNEFAVTLGELHVPEDLIQGNMLCRGLQFASRYDAKSIRGAMTSHVNNILSRRIQGFVKWIKFDRRMKRFTNEHKPVIEAYRNALGMKNVKMSEWHGAIFLNVYRTGMETMSSKEDTTT